MRYYNKENDKLYFGLPDGSLKDRILEILDKVGWPVSADEREYTFPSYKDPDLIFRIRKTREMCQAVAKGVVDCSICGEDMLFETGRENKVVNVGQLPFSRRTNEPSRLVLAALNGTYVSPDELKGKQIATEYPRLTRMKLKEVCGFTNNDCGKIIRSLGKTEAKVKDGEADAIAEITETGKTLRFNGFCEIATLFESYPQMVANPIGLQIKEIREKIEDMYFLMKSKLDADRNPPVMLRFNCREADREAVLSVLPNRGTANILDTESDFISIASLVGADEKRDLVCKLKRAGATIIIGDKPDEIYINNQSNND
jgi:ATP phosphoribosyltransferase